MKKPEKWLLCAGMNIQLEFNLNVSLMSSSLRSANDKKSGATLIFDAPDMEGKYRYTLYFMCDCYLGLDQQYDLNFEVTASEDGEDEVQSGEEDE